MQLPTLNKVGLNGRDIGCRFNAKNGKPITLRTSLIALKVSIGVFKAEVKGDRLLHYRGVSSSEI
jgi:hypothetical protein